MSSEEIILVRVDGVLMSTQGPVVMLTVPEDGTTDKEQAAAGSAVLNTDVGKFRNRVLPIFIDQSQALNIQLALEGQLSPRPMTHDLMSQVMNELGAVVEKVVIEELAQSTFYASLYIEREMGKGEKDIKRFDARPSDCIALAVRVNAPILVRRSLMDQASILRRDVGPIEDAGGEDVDLPEIMDATRVEPDDEGGDIDLGVSR